MTYAFNQKQLDQLRYVCARHPDTWPEIRDGQFLLCDDVELYQQLQVTNHPRNAALLLKSEEDFRRVHVEILAKEAARGH